MILVTGANGLLGSYLCHKLHENKLRFKALVRKESDLSLLKGIPKERILIGNIHDVLGMEAILTEVETVIHCAGMVSFKSEDKEALYRTNVEGTKSLVNACLATNIKKFIHISSIAALGRNNKHLLVGENTKWEDSKLNTEYAKSKYLGELEVWRASSEGLSVNILNPSIILAPYDWNRSSAQILNYVKSNSPFYPSGGINYVDLRDVTEVILKLYTSTIENERFVLNAGSLSYKYFFEQVALRFKRNPPKIRLNPLLGWIGWGLEKTRSTLTGKPSLVTRETMRLSFSRSAYDNQKSVELLNQNYHSLEETLDWVCGVAFGEKKNQRKAQMPS